MATQEFLKSAQDSITAIVAIFGAMAVIYGYLKKVWVPIGAWFRKLKSAVFKNNENELKILLATYTVDGALSKWNSIEIDLRRKLTDFLRWKSILDQKICIEHLEVDKMEDYVDLRSFAESKKADFLLTGDIVTENGEIFYCHNFQSAFDSEFENSQLNNEEKKGKSLKRIRINDTIKNSSKLDWKVQLWPELQALIELSLNPRKGWWITSLSSEEIDNLDYRWILGLRQVLWFIKEYEKDRLKNGNPEKLLLHRKKIESAFELNLSDIKKKEHKVIVILEYIDFLSLSETKNDFKKIIKLHDFCIQYSNVAEKVFYKLNKAIYKANFFEARGNVAAVLDLEKDFVSLKNEYPDIWSLQLKCLGYLSDIYESKLKLKKIHIDDFIETTRSIYEKILNILKIKEYPLFHSHKAISRLNKRYLNRASVEKIYSLYPFEAFYNSIKHSEYKWLMSKIFWYRSKDLYVHQECLLFWFEWITKESICELYRNKIEELNPELEQIKENYKRKRELIHDIELMGSRIWKTPLHDSSFFKKEDETIDTLYFWIIKNNENKEAFMSLFNKLKKGDDILNGTDYFNLSGFLLSNWDEKKWVEYLDKFLMNFSFFELEIKGASVAYMEYLSARSEPRHKSYLLFMSIYLLKNCRHLWTDDFKQNIVNKFLDISESEYLKTKVKAMMDDEIIEEKIDITDSLSDQKLLVIKKALDTKNNTNFLVRIWRKFHFFLKMRLWNKPSISRD